MATERRLIDANVLEEDLELLAKHEDSFRQSVILGVVHTVKAQPTVDAVEVVRCKDCKHRGDETYCPMCYEEEYEIDEGDGYSCSDYITHDRTIDNGFCDRGERQ